MKLFKRKIRSAKSLSTRPLIKREQALAASQSGVRGCWSHAACSAAKHKQATSVGPRQAHVAFVLGRGAMSDLNPKMRRLTDIAELAVSINEYAPGAPRPSLNLDLPSDFHVGFWRKVE
jgi:hypothetical protein